MASRSFMAMTPQEKAEHAWDEYHNLVLQGWGDRSLLDNKQHMAAVAASFDRFDYIFKQLLAS